ncbi:MAG: hypothetical protein LM590_06495 [Thermofilum sp.]|nr:hypothetical protein [Thermofilum sp.]
MPTLARLGAKITSVFRTGIQEPPHGWFLIDLLPTLLSNYSPQPLKRINAEPFQNYLITSTLIVRTSPSLMPSFLLTILGTKNRASLPNPNRLHHSLHKKNPYFRRRRYSSLPFLKKKEWGIQGNFHETPNYPHTPTKL